MSYKSILDIINKKMVGALDHLKKELSGIRGGRASFSLLDHIKVEYYGTPTPLKQVGNLAMPDNRLITIQPWDNSLSLIHI